MSTEPSKFYLGVIDVFSIMLPGALLAFFLPDLLGEDVLGITLPKPGVGANAGEWLVFLFPAYLLGHIVFMVSSFLDLLYDKVIRPRYWPEIGEREFLRAEVLKEQAIGEGNTSVMNAFQWAKSVLILQSSAATLEVEQLEAASKFFRSLVVVFLVLLVLVLVVKPINWFAVPMLLVLMGLSLWLYAVRRHKSVKQACWLVIAQDGIDRTASSGSGEDQQLTHAGGVVYRMHDGMLQYLLIGPKNNAGQWLLPKGHIEPGESPAAAAVREIREESGVVASVVCPVGNIAFRANNEKVNAEFFLMAFKEQGSNEEHRQLAWCAPNAAIKHLSFANHRYLLAVAERLRKGMDKCRDDECDGVEKGTDLFSDQA